MSETTLSPAIESMEQTASSEFDVFVAQWDERARQNHSAPEQQPIPTADGLGLHFDQLTIYHGSPVGGIENIDKAEEHTLAQGIYGTYEPDGGAIGYALKRSREFKSSPVLYELTTNDISMLDLRTPEAIEEFLDGFKVILQNWLQEDHDELQQMPTWITPGLIAKIEDKTTHPNIRLKGMVGRSTLLTDHIRSLGFQGMICWEGGEGDIGRHESWVLCDPDAVTITTEAGFNDPNPPVTKTPDDTANTSEDWWK